MPYGNQKNISVLKNETKTFYIPTNQTINITGKIWGQRTLFTATHVCYVYLYNQDNKKILDIKRNAKEGVKELIINEKITVYPGEHKIKLICEQAGQPSEKSGGYLNIQYQEISNKPIIPDSIIGIPLPDKIVDIPDNGNMIDIKLLGIPAIYLLPVPVLLMIVPKIFKKKGRKK